MSTSRRYKDHTVITVNGHELKIWRTKNAISQEDLAGAYSLSKATVSQWEREITVPNLATAEKLLKDYPSLSKAIQIKRPK